MMLIVSCESTAACNAMAAEQLAMLETAISITIILVILWVALRLLLKTEPLG